MTEYTILVCEDSQEGVFTGIYEAYARRLPLERVYIQIGEEAELRLFSEYCEVKADAVKAAKVGRTLAGRLGEEAYGQICYALLSTDEERGQAVYRTVVEALKAPRSAGSIMDRLTDDSVRKVFELSRRVGNEIMREKEFLRFQELENGVLYAKIGPVNRVLPYIMPHYSNRFPKENFVICDDKRKLFGVHPAGQEWFIAQGDLLQEESLVYSEKEDKYRELFIHFWHKIAIKERKNLKLQQNMLPLRFQEYMTEFGNYGRNSNAPK